MSESRFVSTPTLKQYLRMAEECGVDYMPYLEQAGIDHLSLEDSSNRVPAVAMERFLKLIIPAADDPFFGLHAARFVQHNSFSVLGYIAMNCSNLNEVLKQMPLYEKIVGGAGSSSKIISPDATCLCYNSNFTDPLVRRHVTENVLASWDQFSKTYLQLVGDPRSVCFEHAAPERADHLEIYRDTFHCPVFFDQEFSGTWINNADLFLPIEQANDQLLNTLLDHASQELRQLDQGRSLAEQVKNILRLMMSKELPNKDRVARELGVSSRTLQRRLADEGAHYQEILDELRLELATHYLARTDMNLDDIAIKLGYLETRSFHRSFKHWTGTTAGEYRIQLQQVKLGTDHY